ncbi:DMT family transporter [Myxacorys almedinensis]|uniref:EamA family transporter n=1 Tax=Myxacorys almedinensis A TaxID=2690445 RepID=A0A8J8CKV4_9CYAN|nr:DMT family transporter [Myxacorys almedinensis]NDJ17045.1 EamA family transporter [Myxacorys almedinensis A]
MFQVFISYRGEIAGLSAALIWACASLVYIGVGRQIAPLALNLTKGWMAIALIALTGLATGQTLPTLDSASLIVLLLSGAIGVGVGDTAYFNALNLIGARRTLLFETLAPALAALLALFFLQEQLSLQAWFGIFLVLAGVVWVVLERLPELSEAPHQTLRGILFGLLAALAQAIGAVLSRSAFIGSDVDTLSSTLIRLIGATLVLLIWGTLQQQTREIVKPLQSQRLFLIIAGTAFISTYLGIWLQQTSLKYAPTGVAQALTSTSPLFVIPLVRLMGDRVSMRAVVGVLIALVGVSLLFSRA